MKINLTQSQFDTLIATLETVRDHSKFYIGKADDVEAIQLFLQGIRTFVGHLSVNNKFSEIYHQIHKSKGWKWSALGPAPAMCEAGLTDEEIVKELVTIEIETYKATFEQAEHL